MPATSPSPYLLKFEDGRPVKTVADWGRRRDELLQMILRLEYGPLPPTPDKMEGQELCRSTTRRPEGIVHVNYRLTAGGPTGPQWMMEMYLPQGPGPFPVVLNGDACWHYASDEVLQDVVGRGNILATFNRTEIYSDNKHPSRTETIERLGAGSDFAALAVWAWGYHRCVDVLSALPAVDAARIAIVGHSRGGKATLLAGATDPRIAVTSANSSGCGGAGSHRVHGPGAEKLADILKNFPFWFSPNLPAYIGRDEALPFDQDALAALAAPRALLFTEALDDPWSNPAGAWQTYLGAKRAYEFLDAAPKLGIVYRKGTHDHTAGDWASLLDFLDVHFHGKPATRRFDVGP